MARLPDPDPRLSKRLGDLEALVKRLQNSSPYAGAGMAPNGANGVVVDGDMIVDGNFDLNGKGTVSGSFVSEAFDGNLATGAPGTTGWAFDNTRAIVPELILRPGSVSNDALTDPVVPGVVNLSANNFASSFPWFNAVSTSLTVPAGCSRLLLTASAWVQINNAKTTGGADGAGSDYIYARVALGATTGQHTSTGVSGNSGTATASSGLAALLSSLTPGDTVTLAGQASTDYANATSTLNKAVLVATLFWLK